MKLPFIHQFLQQQTLFFLIFNFSDNSWNEPAWKNIIKTKNRFIQSNKIEINLVIMSSFPLRIQLSIWLLYWTMEILASSQNN